MSSVVLEVEGEEHDGWTSVEVFKSIETLSGAFNLVLTNRWKAGKGVLNLLPGKECRLSIEGSSIIVGYIDVLEVSYNKDSHEIRVTGRDKSADLIDCSIVKGTGEWKNQTIDKLVNELVSPFGITVKSEIDPGSPIKKFNVEQGMTVHEAIQKLCVKRGCLAISDNDGNLVLTQAGEEMGGSDLVEGENVLEARASYDFTQRFSEYVVKAQEAGDDNIDSATATTHKAKVTDTNIDRYRPTLIVADGQNDQVKAADRAKWEASVRRGKSRTYEIVVQGLSEGSGLWKLNQSLNLKAPSLGVDGALLVAGIKYQVDDQGERTTLTLSPKEAYTPLGSASVNEKDTWFEDLKGLGSL